ASAQKSSIRLRDDIGVSGPRELPGAGHSRRSIRRSFSSTQDRIDARTPVRDITGATIDRRIPADFAQGGDVAGDDDSAAGEGFEQRQAEAFGVAGDQQNGG